jgi:hypothetical protein
MKLRRAPAVPDKYRHKIVQDAASGRWQLLTYSGYRLAERAARAEIDEYYAYHCGAGQFDRGVDLFGERLGPPRSPC